MKRHRKIFYVSGIISLIFIAPLFLYLIQPTLKEMNLRVMDIGLPYKAKKGEKIPEYSQIPMDGWNYKPIEITPNFTEKEEKQIISLIKKLQSDKVEKSGLKFQFSDENTYGDFVKLLNLMQKTKQEFYGVDMEYTNSLYVLYMKPEKDYFGNDTVVDYLNQKDYEYHHASFYEKLINFSPKGIYYIIFGYLLLVYSAILKPKLTPDGGDF